MDVSPKVSAILITWKRQQNIPRIVEELLKYPFIDEIVIGDNSKGDNLVCFRRFAMTFNVKNNWIYFQDDDCLNHDLPKLYEEFCQYPSEIVHGAKQGYLDALSTEEVYKTTNLALIGWGSFIHRDWVNFSYYLAKYPKDDYFCRLADRIFTMTTPHVRHPILCNIEDLTGSTDGNAMSSQATHVAERLECARRCKNL